MGQNGSISVRKKSCMLIHAVKDWNTQWKWCVVCLRVKQMQNSAWEKYKNVENEKSLWCTKQAGQWSNGGRIVKWWLWQKLWTKIFFRSHFLKIYGPQVPILCPSCRQQWVFFSRLATELEFPLLKGFVLPPHFQVRRGTCLVISMFKNFGANFVWFLRHFGNIILT